MVKKSIRWLYRTFLILFWLVAIVFVSSALVLRFFIFPNIDQYKNRIANEVSTLIGLRINIGNIYTGWDGINPHLSLFNIDVYDKENRPELTLEHIETSISWLSIPLLEPRLSSLSIYRPELTIRRETDGSLFVAGISMNGPSHPELPNWILRQRNVNVIDADVLWQDDFRNAPPLNLNKLNLKIVNPALESVIGRHQFSLRAIPSAGSSQPIDIRANLYGKDVSQLQDWRGTIFAQLDGTDIAAWRSWIDYPIDLREGVGGARFWLEIDNGKPLSLTSDIILSNVKTRLSKDSQDIVLKNISGRFKWLGSVDGQQFIGQHIKISTNEGINLESGNVEVHQRLINNQTWLEGKVNLDELQLDSLQQLAGYFPIPQDKIDFISKMSPTGRLKNLELNWQLDPSQLTKYAIRSQFYNLGVSPYNKFPGFSNLSGNIDADETNGTITLNSEKSVLNYDDVMRSPINADRLTGEIKWHNFNNNSDVEIKNLTLTNSNLTGTINADYKQDNIHGDYIDMTGKFSKADAKFAYLYYPKALGDKTVNWLESSIKDGLCEDINLIIRGKIKDFPFPDNKLGLFQVTAKMKDGVLEHSTSWPKIENLKLNLLFEGNRMEINASDGSILGTRIKKAKVSIPELYSTNPVLLVSGEAEGPVSEGVKYINSSPISRVTDGFTSGLRTTGQGRLDLDLNVPINDSQSTKVKGSYFINDGSISNDGIPDLTHINGRLDFTESVLAAQNVSASAYGGPVQFSLNTEKNHVMHIEAHGHFTDIGLRQETQGLLPESITGSSDWSSKINIIDKQTEINIKSDLLGLESNLPPPLNKPSIESMPLMIELKPGPSGQEIVKVGLGKNISAKFLRINQKIDRGEIAFNTQAELPSQQGLTLRGNLDYFSFDDWRDALDKNSSQNSNNILLMNKIDMSFNIFDAFGKRLNGLRINAKTLDNGWQATLQSQEITGDAQWIKDGNGKVVANLKNFILPSSSRSEDTYQYSDAKQTEHYPSLDIVADNFESGKNKLGHLELQASEQDGNWSIGKLKFINPDNNMTATGVWYNWKRNPSTNITFHWDIFDLGMTLKRFGYADTIKGGTANINGQLKWSGSPHEFNSSNLSGNLQLDAKKGQILKIQSGVGRLFSVISLQNLPRRLSLDFKDLFSSGFVFDKISGTVYINKGIMRSDNFKMEGPTAKVDIKGETDLQKETQHLYIKATPFISDTLSLAAFAGGPAVGAAAYIAQKILKDPLNKIASNEYEIIGTWDNPQEKSSDDSSTPITKPLGK